MERDRFGGQGCVCGSLLVPDKFTRRGGTDDGWLDEDREGMDEDEEEEGSMAACLWREQLREEGADQ